MKKFQFVFISAGFTLTSFLIHVYSRFTTMINGGGNSVSNSALSEAILLHTEHPVFSRRKVTTSLITFISECLNLGLGWSFVVVNFLFLFLSGLGVYQLSILITKNTKASLLGLVIYFICFSNFFAFFPPVYTYDEPIQYSLIFFSLILFFKGKIMPFIVVFSFTLLVRETAIILIPGLFCYFVFDNRCDFKKNFYDLNFIKKSLALALPVLVYALYLQNIFANNTHVESAKSYFFLRFSRIGFNFSNSELTIETIASFGIIYLIPVYLLIQAFHSDYFDTLMRKFSKAFFLSFIMNTIIVLLLTRVRELRLLVLPLFFLWPILGVIFEQEFLILLRKKNYLEVFSKINPIICFILLTCMNLLVAFQVYNATVGPQLGLFNLYLFLSLELVLLHVIMKYHLSKNILS